MANAVKGEVAFDLDGKTYTLVLDFNALCEVEDVLGAGEMKLAKPSAIRAIFWAALRRHHPAMTQRDAGNLIGGVGLTKAGELVTEALNRSGLFGGDGEAEAHP